MHSRIDTPHILIMCISLTAKAFRVHCCLNTKRRWKQNTPPGRGSRIAHGSRDACLCLVPSGSLWLPLVPSVPSGSLWFPLVLLGLVVWVCFWDNLFTRSVDYVYAFPHTLACKRVPRKYSHDTHRYIFWAGAIQSVPPAFVSPALVPCAPPLCDGLVRLLGRT